MFLPPTIENPTVLDAVKLLGERMDAFESLWQIDGTVTIAFIGFVAAYREKISGVVGWFFGIAYLSFAAGNYRGIMAMLDQRWALYRWASTEFDKSHSAVITPFQPDYRCNVMFGHILADILTVLLILFLTQPCIQAWLGVGERKSPVARSAPRVPRRRVVGL